MRRLLLLRPEPGLTASSRRAEAMGLETVSCPLFEVVPLPWTAPGADEFDGLLLTSANAVRHAGPGLETYRDLPVYAVGPATAAAATAEGLEVEQTGPGGVAALLSALPSTLRLLHLGGLHRTGNDHPGGVFSIAVYESRQIDRPALPDVSNMVIAVHSPRAGKRIAELVEHRAATSIAAISHAAAVACGDGWSEVAVAAEPSDAQLLALANKLCQTGGG